MALSDQIVESQTLTDSAVSAVSKTFTGVSVSQDDGAGETGRYMLGALVSVSSASAGVTINRVSYGAEVLAPDSPGQATAAGRPATRTFTAGEWATGSQNLVVTASGTIDSVVVYLFVVEEAAEECLPPFGAAPRTDTFNRLSLNPIWTLSNGDGAASISFSQTAGIIRANMAISASPAADYGDGNNNSDSPSLRQAVTNGNFNVTVQKETTATLPASGTVVGLSAAGATDNFNFFRVAHYQHGGGTQQYADSGAGNGNYEIYADTGAPQADTAYLRLIRTGNNFDGDDGANGTTFNNVVNETFAMTVARVGLDAGTYNGQAFDIDIFRFINNNAAVARTPQDAQTALQFLSNNAASATSISLAFTENTTEGAALIDLAIVAAGTAAGEMSAGTGDELLAEGVVTSTNGIRYAIVGALTEVSGTTAGTTIGSTWTGAASASVAGLQFRAEELAEGGGPEAAGALSLPSPTLDGAGTVTATVTATGTLGAAPLTFSGAGDIVNSVDGSLSIALPALSMAGAGTVTPPVDGSGNLALAPLEFTGSGLVVETVTGSGSMALPALAFSGAGTVAADQESSGLLAAAPLTLAGAGTVDAGNFGTGSLAAAPLALNGAGTVDPGATGAGAVSLPSLAFAGAGDVGGALSGSGSLSSPPATFAGSGTVLETVTATATLAAPALTFSGAGTVDAGNSGSGSFALPSPSLSGAGIAGAVTTGSGSFAAAALELSGAGNVDPGANAGTALATPSLAFAGAGTVDPGNFGSGQLSLPSPSLTGAGLQPAGPVASGLLTMPAPLNFSGAGFIVNPLAGASLLSLPSLGFSGVGTIENPLPSSGVMTLPALGFAGSGVVDPGNSGSGVFTLQALTMVGAGFDGIIDAPQAIFDQEIRGFFVETRAYGIILPSGLEVEDMSLEGRYSTNLERAVGETHDFVLVMPESVSGSTFTLVANSQADPDDNSQNIFSLTGLIDVTDETIVSFTPSLADVTVPPGLYYYRAWRTDPDNVITSPSFGRLKMLRGISV